MGQPTARSNEHLLRLDGLRGIAALTVIAGHVADTSLGYPRYGELGAVAVLFFFILSGYVITTSLERQRERNGDIDVGDFYLRRAIRILPAFWVLLVTVALLKLGGVVNDVTWKAVLACLFFVRNIRGRGQSLSHIWTLSLIEQFYFCWPVAMKRLTQTGSLVVALVLSLACTLWRTYGIATQMYPYETDVFYLRTDFRIDSILIGAALALALRDAQRRRWLTGMFDHAFFSLTLPALGGWALLATDVTPLHPAFITVEMVLALLVFGRLITRVPTDIAPRFCAHPAFVALGRMSFSLYLWQQLFVVRHDPSWGMISQFPLNLISIALVATLSFFAVERPALQLRRRLARSGRLLEIVPRTS